MAVCKCEYAFKTHKYILIQCTHRYVNINPTSRMGPTCALYNPNNWNWSANFYFTSFKLELYWTIHKFISKTRIFKSTTRKNAGLVYKLMLLELIYLRAGFFSLNNKVAKLSRQKMISDWRKKIFYSRRKNEGILDEKMRKRFWGVVDQ